MIRLSFVLAVLVLAGCGSSPDLVGPNAVTSTIDVSLSPERRWYQTGQQVQLVGFITDEDGALVEGDAIDWQVTPADAGTVVATGATADIGLLRQGQVVLSGCIAASGLDGFPRVCDSLTIQVDDGSPVLELTAPSPGSESDDPRGIVVAGSVSDGGLARVFVAGHLVPVDGLGRFETVVPAWFGVNHVEVVASDAVTSEAAVEMDVLWAPAFAPAIADDTPSVAFASGISLSLGQPLFDDRVALDTDATPIATQDLADIVQLVVTHADLGGAIPDPVVDQAGFTLRIPALEVGPAAVSLDVESDGIELFLRLPALAITTAGSLRIDDTVLDLGGTVAASVAGSAHVRIGKSDGGELVVELTDLSLALETATGTFASAETGALFRLAQGLLRTTIEQQLVGAVEQTVADTVPAVLRSVLGALDTALADRDIVLEPDFAAPVTLQLDGRLTTVVPVAGVELRSNLRARVGSESTVVHPTTRGVALSEIGNDEPRFHRDRPLQLGVRLGFLNGLLHTLWSSGLFEIELLGLVGGDLAGLLESGQIAGKLPPVLRAARPGESNPFVLSIGQLELELVLKDGSHATFAVTLDVDVELDVDGSTIAVLAPNPPRIRIWTLVASDSALLAEGLIVELLLDQWPSIRDSLIASLHVELPLPSLGDLGDIAPDLAALQLRLELLSRPAIRDGWLMIEGALRGSLP